MKYIDLSEIIDIRYDGYSYCLSDGRLLWEVRVEEELYVNI
jgi:hypothetical protein